MVNLSFGIVALGANLPGSARDPADSLRTALRILHEAPGISITAVSRLWRTPAHPAGAGPDYANGAVRIATALPPDQVLACLHAIEAGQGRSRDTGRWSARVLDLDLIALDDRILPDPAGLRAWIDLPPDRQATQAPDRLILPHPRMQDRAFVLVPMAEIAPGWTHPLTGRTVLQMLADLGPQARRGMSPIGLA